MKRLIFCGCFFALVLVLHLGSSYSVQQYTNTVSAHLESAQTAAMQEHLTLAMEEVGRCIAYSRKQEHLLALFIRRETFTHLDEVLNAALEYAKNGNAEETLAEIARAESQLYGLRHLFAQTI